jgi:TatD DNase family protein
MSNLIDSHVHLDQLEDIQSALIRAKDAGVCAVVAVGIDYISCVKLTEIIKSSYATRVFIALGMHPSEINENQIGPILNLIQDNIKEIVAIGEIGLDYWYKPAKKDKSKKEQQKQVFRTQLQIAKKYGKPVSIHSRGAWNDCLNICLEEKIEKAIFHWYSGPLDILNKLLANNYFISATPSLAYSPQHRDAVKQVPLESLLIETDAPVYFGKPQMGGFRAEPKDVNKTLELVSELKNEAKDKILEQTARNAQDFFGIKI